MNQNESDNSNLPNTKENASDNSKPTKKPFGISNGLALVLAILFVLFAVVGVIGFNIWRVLFNPQLVKQTLENEVVSSELVPSTLEVFSEWRAEQRVENNESLSGVNEPDIVLLMSFLKAEDWRDIKQLLVTDEFVVHLISMSVDGLYLWIDSDDLWPEIVWDMTLLKSRMSGQEGIDSVMIAYLKLPPATEEEIADFKHRLSQVPEGVEVLYNLCQFPDPWHDDQVADYVDAIKDASDNISVNFNFSEEFGMASDQTADPLSVKSLLRLIRFLAITAWIVALVLLLLILFLKVRSKRTLGKFIGIPLIISGALIVIIALIGQPVIIKAITNSLLSTTSDFARLEITNSLGHLTSIFFTPLFIQGAVLAGLGIIMVVIMFIKKRKTSSAEDDSEQKELP